MKFGIIFNALDILAICFSCCFSWWNVLTKNNVLVRSLLFFLYDDVNLGSWHLLVLTANNKKWNERQRESNNKVELWEAYFF